LIAGLDTNNISTMSIDVIEEPVTVLAEYGGIPIIFEVGEIFEVVAEVDGGVRLEARRVPVPYVKDYDAIGDRPTRWVERFDLSNWGFFSAFSGAQCVGRAAVARDTSTLEILEGRRDLALLWDIRVAPLARRCGVGSALFDAVTSWARSRGCLQLKVETQNINVAACRFYAQQGCVLRSVERGAYPELPDEIQLLWFKDLLRRPEPANELRIRVAREPRQNPGLD
jgi:GNAT superfamily N-acetyltransferase